MKRRDHELAKGGGQIDHPHLFDTAGGKQKLNCANTEGIFRIILETGEAVVTGENYLHLTSNEIMQLEED